MVVSPSISTASVFASLNVNGVEYLINCAPANSTCTLLQVVPGLNGPVSELQGAGSTGRKLKIAPIVLVFAVAALSTAGVGAAAGISAQEKGCFPGDALVSRRSVCCAGVRPPAHAMHAALSGVEYSRLLSIARPCTPQVFTSSGRLTALSALQSGERVLSMSAAGVASYQEVFMWGHRDAGALVSFVAIRAGGATLRATPGERLRAVPELLHAVKHWRP